MSDRDLQTCYNTRNESIECKSRGRRGQAWAALAPILVASVLAGGCILIHGGTSRDPAPAATEATLVGYVLAHGSDANRYAEPLRQWMARED